MDFIEALITALRSGEYKQTSGQLRIDDSFCAEGVALDVAMKLGLTDVVWTQQGYAVGWRYPNLCGISTAFLPAHVSEMLSSVDVDLMDLNDGCEKTFPEIADILEAEYVQSKTQDA